MNVCVLVVANLLYRWIYSRLAKTRCLVKLWLTFADQPAVSAWRRVFCNWLLDLLFNLAALKAQDEAVNSTPNMKYLKALLSPFLWLMHENASWGGAPQVQCCEICLFLITVVVNMFFFLHIYRRVCICPGFYQLSALLDAVSCVYTPSNSEEKGQRSNVGSFIHLYSSFYPTHFLTYSFCTAVRFLVIAVFHLFPSEVGAFWRPL